MLHLVAGGLFAGKYSEFQTRFTFGCFVSNTCAVHFFVPCQSSIQPNVRSGTWGQVHQYSKKSSEVREKRVLIFRCMYNSFRSWLL